MDTSSVDSTNANANANTTGGSDSSSSIQDGSAANAGLSATCLETGSAYDSPAAQREVAEAIATQQPIELEGPVCYAMQPGQTLQDVATAFGVDMRDLALANDIVNPETVYPGDMLSVPGPQDKQEIGSLSAHYETGGRGPGTVSTGNGDIGGVSYGSYQLSTAAGRPQEFLANEGAAWAGEFAGQQPGTAAFSQTWRDVAAREPEAFQQAQHDYIERTHYDVQADRVESRTTVTAADGSVVTPGLDLGQHSRALQNVAWSTAVQHGPNSNIVANAVASVRDSGLQDWEPGFDRAVIDAVYDERGRRNADGELAHFSRNSTAVQEGVANRFVNERADATAALDAEDRALRESMGLPER